MDFNDPETWLTPELHDAPAFAVADYQKRIDEICGLNEFGGPNVRVTWMPAQENYTRYFCEWADSGFGTRMELRAQYVYTTLSDGRGNELEIPPPRWALKQFVHPAQYFGTDERLRWKKRVGNNDKQSFVREIRPARDPKGYYSPMIAIGRHNGYCCRQAKKNRQKCWGDYRTPDESYLLWLKEAVHERAARDEERPEAGFTPKLLQKAAVEAAATIERRKRIAENALDELIEQNLDSMLAYYLGDPALVEREKEYSFAKPKETGIIVPKTL